MTSARGFGSPARALGPALLVAVMIMIYVVLRLALPNDNRPAEVDKLDEVRHACDIRLRRVRKDLASKANAARARAASDHEAALQDLRIQHSKCESAREGAQSKCAKCAEALDELPMALESARSTRAKSESLRWDQARLQRLHRKEVRALRDQLRKARQEALAAYSILGDLETTAKELLNQKTSDRKSAAGSVEEVPHEGNLHVMTASVLNLGGGGGDKQIDAGVAKRSAPEELLHLAKKALPTKKASSPQNDGDLNSENQELEAGRATMARIKDIMATTGMLKPSPKSTMDNSKDISGGATRKREASTR